MKPSAILSADWHIRSKTPLCRTDDYLETQRKKVKFICNIARKYSLPIYLAGDLGDKPRWDMWLLDWFISETKDVKIHAIAGQHDLLNYRVDSIHKTALGVLLEAGAISLSDNLGLYKTHFGEEINPKGDGVLLTHQMIVKEKDLFPQQNANHAHFILKKHTNYRLIVSGDNHIPFTYKNKSNGHLLVNPGSIMRMTSDQINHKPRIYLWDEQTNEVEAVYLPIKKDVIDRSHIDIKKEKDDRIEAFVKNISQAYEVELSFTNNLENYFNENKTRKRIKEKVMEAVNGIS